MFSTRTDRSTPVAASDGNVADASVLFVVGETGAAL